MNEQLKCPRCGTAAQIVDGYNNCGTCKTMDPEQWVRDNQSAIVSSVVVEVKNADGKTVEQVKAEAAAAKAIKDKEDEDRFYRELIAKAKAQAPAGQLSTMFDFSLLQILTDAVTLKWATFVAETFAMAVKMSDRSSDRTDKSKRIEKILAQTVRQIAEVEAE